MKIKIEVDENIGETEVTIKVKQLNQEVYEIQNILSELFSKKNRFFSIRKILNITFH